MNFSKTTSNFVGGFLSQKTKYYHKNRTLPSKFIVSWVKIISRYAMKYWLIDKGTYTMYAFFFFQRLKLQYFFRLSKVHLISQKILQRKISDSEVDHERLVYWLHLLLHHICIFPLMRTTDIPASPTDFIGYLCAKKTTYTAKLLFFFYLFFQLVTISFIIYRHQCWLAQWQNNWS